MGKLRSHGATDVGRRRRNNEDAFLRDDDLGLYVVADGLGGHASGHIASHEAVDTIEGWVKRERAVLDELSRNGEDIDLVEAARQMIESAIMAATYHVFALGQYDQRNSGMGTTISALVAVGNVGVIAQVGDSRIYRVRDGGVAQLTDDHTLVALQVRAGLLTPEEALTVPHRNVITRAVGSRDYVQVDTSAVSITDGDVFLLCTDGLHNYLTADDVITRLAQSPVAAAVSLVEMANDRGGKDNITAVVVKVVPDAA